MQKDMHYFGTYVLACAAGMKPEAARVVATAAEFVDDNADGETLRIQDGARLDVDATAHHNADIRNIDLEDQRRIWLPFHFLPGNEGDTYDERLLCRKDSVIARQMVEHNLGAAREPYALELLGVTAHVYADTFAHYGFSGVSSSRNVVDTESFEFYELSDEIERYVRDKAVDFFKKYKRENGNLLHFEFAKPVRTTWEKIWEIVTAFFAQRLSGALGHAAVATFPDRPYLIWSFDYKHRSPSAEKRSNPVTYLQACEGLHAMFCRFLDEAPQYRADEGFYFDKLSDRITEIITAQGTMEQRIEIWQRVAQSGELFRSAPHVIPNYSEDDWLTQLLELAAYPDSRAIPERNIYRFFQAAAMHRNYVLRNLLPSHGLIVQ